MAPVNGDNGALVTCARCGRQILLSVADIVPFGTGYQCERCSLGQQVTTHLNEAAQHEAHHRGWLDTTNPQEPTLKQVVALVEAAEKQPIVGGVPEAALRPEVLEPVIADDASEAYEFAHGSSSTTTPPSNAESLAADGPYRSTGLTRYPRYICIVCFRVASDGEGECPHDRVALSDVENPEIVAELRTRVRRSANRREGWRFGSIFGVALAIAVVVCLCFDIDMGRRGGIPVFIAALIGMPPYLLSFRIVPALRVRNNVSSLLAAVGLTRPQA
jgi:hypothetical protein